MKYTRYDMKKRKNNNYVFALILVSTIVFAFVIGTVFSKFFLKNSNFNEPKVKSPSNAVNVSNNNSEEKKVIKYIAVQGGKFAKSEYLENARNTLKSYGNPFTIKEEDGTRVFLGIYSEQDAVNVIKTLTDNSIANSKMTFQVTVSSSDACNDEIVKLIDGELGILSILSDKSVKSYITDEFKRWCSQLKEVDKKSKNIDVLNELKAQANSLPNELGKDKSEECYIFIYNTLKKLTAD
jgi:hypothetical protein